MLLRRILLAPFTALYGGVLHLRHALYDAGILKSTRPPVPTIAIGNLALGGTGKTPMMELVLRTLEGTGPVATLSRGYGRRTRTIHEVTPDDTADRSGDEPLQVKHNLPGVRVFVGADRVKAIAHIQQAVPEVKAVVLDDALQHRRLDAGLNILLTTWQRPYCDDALVPAGTLRDLRSRAKAAQVVVVTKCAALPAAAEQQRWRERLGLRPGQALFFAGIEYGEPRPIDGGTAPATHRVAPTGTRDENDATAILLFTGIADPAPLATHLRERFAHVEHIAFADHRPFTPNDLQGLARRFHKFAPGPKTLITTEKDAARLRSVIAGSAIDGLPLAVIGMRAVILNEPERFADLIRHHAGPHQAHRRPSEEGHQRLHP
ncbi:MAG: tetraacyldisaccharide 4'-kinase [Flavobacteriales bacterium]|jgi:tetraacyldisaccharide 4'-kinase|nr:tetraacyldisaccharide 4'-kinase [Flavobacteriales bacterium]